jgi:hypothetical protein
MWQDNTTGNNQNHQNFPWALRWKRKSGKVGYEEISALATTESLFLCSDLWKMKDAEENGDP